MDWPLILSFLAGFLVLALLRIRQRIIKVFKESRRNQILQVIIIYSIIFLMGAGMVLFYKPSDTDFGGMILYVLGAILISFMFLFRHEILPEVGNLSILMYTILFWFIVLSDKTASQQISVLPAVLFGVMCISLWFSSTSYIHSSSWFKSLLYTLLSIIMMPLLFLSVALVQSMGVLSKIIDIAYLVPTFGVAFLVLTKKIMPRALLIFFYSWFVYTVLAVALYQLQYQLQPLALDKDMSIFSVIINNFALGAAIFSMSTYIIYFPTLLPFKDESGKIIPSSANLIYERYSQKQTGVTKTIPLAVTLAGSLWINGSMHLIQTPLLVSFWILATYYIDRNQEIYEIPKELIEKTK